MLKRWVRSFLFSPLHGEVLSFILGSLTVAILHQLVHGSLELAPALVSFGLLAVAAWSMLYVRSVSGRISRILEESQTSLQYIHEPFDPSEGFSPTGRIHETLAEVVSRAHCQIYVFAVHWDGGQQFDQLDAPARRQYFEAIERKLIEKTKDGFEYIRIIQIPQGRENEPLNKVMELTTYSHCMRVAELAMRFQEAPGFRIRFFKTTQRMAGGFMLVDQRHLSLGLDGTSVSRVPCFSGQLLIDDRGGAFVREWRRYFKDIRDSAQAVHLSAFLEESPQGDNLAEPALGADRREASS